MSISKKIITNKKKKLTLPLPTPPPLPLSPMLEGRGAGKPLARATACFMISLSMPDRGVVRADTVPLLSEWEEGGSRGRPMPARRCSTLQWPDTCSERRSGRVAGGGERGWG